MGKIKQPQRSGKGMSSLNITRKIFQQSCNQMRATLGYELVLEKWIWLKLLWASEHQVYIIFLKEKMIKNDDWKKKENRAKCSKNKLTQSCGTDRGSRFCQFDLHQWAWRRAMWEPGIYWRKCKEGRKRNRWAKTGTGSAERGRLKYKVEMLLVRLINFWALLFNFFLIEYQNCVWVILRILVQSLQLHQYWRLLEYYSVVGMGNRDGERQTTFHFDVVKLYSGSVSSHPETMNWIWIRCTEWIRRLESQRTHLYGKDTAEGWLVYISRL